MTSFWTTRGLRRMNEIVFQGATPPATFYLAAVKATPAPSRATVTFSQLGEIAAGSGYVSGGIAVARDANAFDVLTEDAVGFLVDLELADLAWTATGGPIPASGSGARYVVLLDNNGTVANREVWFVWDLQGDRAVSVGQAITMRDLTLRSQSVIGS